MGKNLKGKELGVGISQNKNGYYVGRFTDKAQKRHTKYFKKLQDCRSWIADAEFEAERGNALRSDNPTVREWFEYWMTHMKGDNIRYNTKRNYNDRYYRCVDPVIGCLPVKSVKPLHCQEVLIKISDNHADSIIKACRTLMHSFFDSAVENDLITKNPVTKSVRCGSKKETKPPRVLTTTEQKAFLNAVKESSYYNHWSFILQTGLRVGELTGLKWQDVDLQKNIIRISRTMECRKKENGWTVSPPKTKKGNREIPLTKEALKLLQNQRETNNAASIPEKFNDFIFLGKNGEPVTATAYNSIIEYYCKKTGIDKFSMHTFRHTFATRCIEAGMKPKTLQIILGHSDLSMTMNLYVHITDDEKEKEIARIEENLKLV